MEATVDRQRVSLFEVTDKDKLLAAAAAEKLCAHYPNYRWAVSASHATGLLVIKNFDLSYKFGYRLRIRKDLDNDPTLKRVVTAGGEILERFGLVRGSAVPLSLDHFKPWLAPPPTAL